MLVEWYIKDLIWSTPQNRMQDLMKQKSLSLALLKPSVEPNDLLRSLLTLIIHWYYILKKFRKSFSATRFSHISPLFWRHSWSGRILLACWISMKWRLCLQECLAAVQLSDCSTCFPSNQSLIISFFQILSFIFASYFMIWTSLLT